MLTNPPTNTLRPLKTVSLACDLVVGGGGLSGVCAAISAARAGLKVVLVQDRPVLGGNGSSEVRLWILGATSHMGNNNRWAREGGVIDEFMVENTHRNREGNPVFVDALLLEMVAREPNITLLLNTVIHDLEKSDADTIRSLRAFNPQNSTEYAIAAPLFCDATGDGLIGFLAGAAFRMGAESRAEFGEGMAPGDEFGELLGHSLYFYSRDTGRPVKFTPPSFALQDITKIPRYKDFSSAEQGCKLWWVEYGGRMDTVHDTEEIKWELWKVIYGVWNYIKNSGKFPEAETMTLEWVGALAGKRESRRFEGDLMLAQRDLIEQIPHPDDVSFGGWAIDLHPADGVYSPIDGCTQYHAKGVYGIPYRTMYSRNIKNLFLAGRIISASHVAYGSSRVMATCGHNAAAVGLAAALCKKYNKLPRDIAGADYIKELQRELLKRGQYIPGVPLRDPADLVPQARLAATSELQLAALGSSGRYRRLNASWAMMIPVAAGPAPKVTYFARAEADTTLRVELRVSSKLQNHTPDTLLATREITLKAGGIAPVELAFAAPDNPQSTVHIPHSQYAFYIVHANPAVEVALSDRRVTGILALTHEVNKAVAKSAVQTPPDGVGVDTFEFWLPRRRPAGENLACKIDPPVALYGAQNLVNGLARPVSGPNAWAAASEDSAPAVTLRWAAPQTVRRIVLAFDTDYDHPMESVQMGHPESDMPFCVSSYKILDASGKTLVEETGNYLSQREHVLAAPVTTTALRVELSHPSPHIPAALFAIRAYAE
ncbi:FAD-dependent oxidoreductase [Termitidicoccus mucosus]|uniref:Fumarate reductase n=1 Tax=Termitidicoccus mucosus TaxID=1184151 RepID=A0A178IK89_9BACT|nr:fumarate reductase [Opitutaceae bacterium TSB47]